jgi:hypothetical protein
MVVVEGYSNGRGQVRYIYCGSQTTESDGRWSKSKAGAIKKEKAYLRARFKEEKKRYLESVILYKKRIEVLGKL